MNTQQDKESGNFWVVSVFVACAAIIRLVTPTLAFLPHNFAPVNSLALFGGAKYRRSLAFIFPLLVIWFSDLLLDRCYFGKWMLFYPNFYWQYLGYLVIAILGHYCLQKITVWRIFGTALLSSFAFFVISNFGVWVQGVWYQHTFIGLVQCYLAGLPFLKGTILGDLFYTVVLFGGYQLLEKTRIPQLDASRNDD